MNMDYDSALKLLREKFSDNKIAKHCIATSKKAVELTEKLQDKGHQVDVELVRVGALLHDIGRSRTHTMDHNYEGGSILRELGFKELAQAVERHGANIFDEIHPNEMSLEEKIIYLADKYTEEDKYVTLDERFQHVIDRRKEHGNIDEIPRIMSAVEVTKKIEKELNQLLED